MGAQRAGQQCWSVRTTGGTVWCSLEGRPELLSNGHSCCMCLKMYAVAKVTWMGPWEGTAKAPLTGGEHRCQGQDKSWGAWSGHEHYRRPQNVGPESCRGEDGPL